MDNNFLDQFSDILHRRRKIQVNEKFIIFSFFLVFACIIWYLNKLSGDYVVDLKVPLKIVYTESDKLLVTEEAPMLKLQVKAKGYILLKYKIRTHFSPIQIDISSYKLNHYNGMAHRYYLLTSHLKNNISTFFPGNLRIENINPDTLFFNFSTLSMKKVPVVAVSRLSFDEQYMQVGAVRLKPDSVIISGPESVLSQKRYVKTLPIKDDNLSKSISGTISLHEERNIILSDKEVAYSVTVAKFTEGKVHLPIRYLGADSLNTLLIPASVDVTYRVAVDDYSKVQPAMFKIGIGNEPKTSLTNNVKVQVIAAPSFVTDIRVHPEFVELYNQK